MKDQNSILIICLRLAIPTAVEVQLINGFQHFEVNLYPAAALLRPCFSAMRMHNQWY